MSMDAGWYPDPFSSANYLRWWDGTQWTSQTTLPGARQSAPAHYRGPGQQPAGQAGYGAPPTAQVATFPVATWGARLAAYLIDALLMAVVLVPLYLAMLWPALRDFIDEIPTDGSPMPVATMTSFETRVLGMSLALSVVSLVVMFVYMVPQNVWYGRTVGKRALGIRIRMLAEDRNPRWGEATIRYAVFGIGSAFAGGIFVLVDCLWPLWDKPWAQALHDKAAKTVVVPART